MQDDFSGVPLAALASRGLGVYELIPDYRQRCPLCSGAGCAVRHGLYRRRVVDRGGTVIEGFPVPRFRCRRRGPCAPRAATFSVLPALLVPRRRASLPLMMWILGHLFEGGRSMRSVLDALAEAGRDSPCPWYPEAPAVYRMVRLFSEACPRLGCGPETDRTPLSAPESRRRQARWVLGILTHPARASPVVLAYHRRCFPRILFGPRREHSPEAVHTP